MTAAATTGPASGPRPASSHPAIGQTLEGCAFAPESWPSDFLLGQRQARRRLLAGDRLGFGLCAIGTVATLAIHARHDEHARARCAMCDLQVIGRGGSMRS